jgi:hypothetical protein
MQDDKNIRASQILRESYAEQLKEIGKILVRAGVLAQEEIERQGVRFAVRDRFEPLTGAVPKAVPKRSPPLSRHKSG